MDRGALQVAPGDYRIQFSPALPYLDEYYNDAATSERPTWRRSARLMSLVSTPN